jgi:hypothetical protein
VSLARLTPVFINAGESFFIKKHKDSKISLNWKEIDIST